MATTDSQVDRLWALLFAEGQPLGAESLQGWLGIGADELARLTTELALRLGSTPFRLREVNGGWQVVLTPELSRFVQDCQPTRPPDQLSPAAWECLAVVAYRQPVTRLELTELRQVNSDHALDTLLDRNLVHEVGRKETPGRPILYGTTAFFLETFGLAGLEALPELPSSLLDFQGSGRGDGEALGAR